MAAERRSLQGWRPRSLQSRQLLAASLGLIAFLALAGYALDRAFRQTAESDLHQRLKSLALAYTAQTEFARDGTIIPGGFGSATGGSDFGTATTGGGGIVEGERL